MTIQNKRLFSQATFFNVLKIHPNSNLQRDQKAIYFLAKKFFLPENIGIMFKKRIKKTYPDGTFIPTPPRISSIIHLILALTLLIWILSIPFADNHFEYKSDLLLFKNVMGIPSNTSEEITKNASRFSSLPQDEQTSILKGYHAIQAKLDAPFSEKTFHSFRLLLFDTPLFQRAWLFFSLIIPIMLLKRADGSIQSVFLLVLITFCFALENRISPNSQNTSDASFLPTEKLLVDTYLDHPLSKNIFKQKEELKSALDQYMIYEFVKETPSQDPATRKLQVEDGEYAFNVLRTKTIAHQYESGQREKDFSKTSLFLIALYLFWNIFFAITVWKYRKDICSMQGIAPSI